MRARRRGRTGGFTLAELLVVMAIIMVVIGMSVPAMKGITEGNAMQSALGKIVGTLEAARTYAVANNTHTYVAFTENAVTGDAEVRMVAMASRSGIDINPDDAADKYKYPGGPVDLIVPIEALRAIRLDGTIPPGNVLRESSQTLPEAQPLARFDLGEFNGSSFKVGTQPEFTRMIHFLPSGEAQLKNGPPEAIEMVVIPERSPGVESELANRQATVIRISGLTGQASVFSPR